MATVEIHVLRWAGDHAAAEDEDHNTMFGSVVMVDGFELADACETRVESSGDRFSEVWVRLAPAKVEYVYHDRGDWPPTK